VGLAQSGKLIPHLSFQDDERNQVIIIASRQIINEEEISNYLNQPAFA
jgi:hypothetical protein